ncbi:MAG: hypothetical protein V1726_00885 [Methanobacteriota archaeon]
MVHAEEDDGWYYLPSYTNYAPNGLPDFDQKQDTNWTGKLGWSFCGPTALADVLWWFDSKHSNPNGSPGDGVDEYPLVRDYSAPGSPQPGPYSDDHNFNNINDPQTRWDGGDGNKELIEQLAWYTNTNFCRTPLIKGFGGTHNFFMKRGAEQWIKDAGLQDDYHVEVLVKPSFDTIVERVRNNEGVLLRLAFYIPLMKYLSVLSYHFIAVAGVNGNGSIAVSDPEWDVVNPSEDPTLHNNASIVSHDTYQVNFTSPYPRISSWWIPQYAHHRRVVITHAVIISETKSSS